MSKEETRGITGDSKPEQVKWYILYDTLRYFNLTSSGLTFHSVYINTALMAELVYNPFFKSEKFS